MSCAVCATDLANSERVRAAAALSSASAAALAFSVTSAAALAISQGNRPYNAS
jgi:hypothetical protein